MNLVVAWRRNEKAISGTEIEVVVCPDLHNADVMRDGFINLGWDARIEHSPYISSKASWEVDDPGTLPWVPGV